MSGDWEYVDVADLIAERPREPDASPAGRGGVVIENPFGSNLSDPSAYVIDPDYAEILGISDYEDLIRYRR